LSGAIASISRRSFSSSGLAEKRQGEDESTLALSVTYRTYPLVSARVIGLFFLILARRLSDKKRSEIAAHFSQLGTRCHRETGQREDRLGSLDVIGTACHRCKVSASVTSRVKKRKPTTCTSVTASASTFLIRAQRMVRGSPPRSPWLPPRSRSTRFRHAPEPKPSPTDSGS